MSVLSHPRFHDEIEAFKWLEEVLWANGTVCPHCGVIGGRVYDLSDVRGHKSVKNPEGAIRYGLKKCGECRKQFTVKVNTVFEHARMPLHKMLQAAHLLASSKKGISSHQLSRLLEISYKAAWFLSHRLREAMRGGGFAPMGGIVEVDETFIGNVKGLEKRRGWAHKMKVLSLVSRETGEKRSFVVDGVNAATIMPIVKANIIKEAMVMTDDSGVYLKVGDSFHAHGVVNHSAEEYVVGIAHTNTIEGSFSIFKRGMKGIYQHCAEKHLHRYLAEFDFRYTHRERTGFNDAARSEAALRGIAGKRLTYGRPL